MEALAHLRFRHNTSEHFVGTCPFGWSYDANDKWSVVAEFDLVCSRNYLASLLMTINSIGGICGQLFSSQFLRRGSPCRMNCLLSLARDRQARTKEAPSVGSVFVWTVCVQKGPLYEGLQRYGLVSLVGRA